MRSQQPTVSDVELSKAKEQISVITDIEVTENNAEGISPELISKLLANPEMAALLKTLAKSI